MKQPHLGSLTISIDLTQYGRIVLLTDGASTPFLAKTAISLLRYRTDDVCAILDRGEVGKTADELFQCGGSIPVVGSLESVNQPDALLIGIAPPGGRMPDGWRSLILGAITKKIDVISGLHQFLCDDVGFCNAAMKHKTNLIDVRKNNVTDLATGCGLNSSCFRIHTVGNDCSVGKMVTSIEIQKSLSDRGFDAAFAATGQTGIMISGTGVPIDCVVGDFINGAAEKLVRQHEDREFVVVEGQGCVTHPAYSAVTLGLLHGCAPDVLVLCYEATRTHVKGFGDIRLQSLSHLRKIYEQIASARHPCKIVGVAMNSRLLGSKDFEQEKRIVEHELGLPVCDVIRENADVLADAIIQHKLELSS